MMRDVECVQHTIWLLRPSQTKGPPRKRRLQLAFILRHASLSDTIDAV